MTKRYISRLIRITPTIESSPAAQKGSPNEDMSEYANTAPSITKEPWAKFTTLEVW